MNDPKINVQTVSISSLTPDPVNARKHSDQNIRAIASSLSRFGQRRPLVVTGDGVILAGNGTLQAALSLGWADIVITRTPKEWDYDTARAYALADNRTAELAEWDSLVLADQLLELDSVGWDLAELGFDTLTPPTESDPGDAFAALPDGDRNDATQITFTLTLAQAQMIKDSLLQAIARMPMDDTGNTNSNGNAISYIVRKWSDDLG